jgi:hypothetical protein
MIGRFISKDSVEGDISDPLSLNRYTYCENNPLKYVDPSGNDVGTFLNSINDKYIGGPLNRLNENVISPLYQPDGTIKGAVVSTIGAVSSAGVVVLLMVSGSEGVVVVLGGGSVLQKQSMGIEGMSNTGAKLGTSFGKTGTLVENPSIKVNWDAFAEHGLERMAQRGVTQDMVNSWVSNGKALQQGANKYLFVTQEGAAVVTNKGNLVTTYSSKFFDENMANIVKQLYRK